MRSAISSESPLRGLWGRLDPQRQDALALGHDQARRGAEAAGLTDACPPPDHTSPPDGRA